MQIRVFLPGTNPDADWPRLNDAVDLPHLMLQMDVNLMARIRG